MNIVFLMACLWSSFMIKCLSNFNRSGNWLCLDGLFNVIDSFVSWRCIMLVKCLPALVALSTALGLGSSLQSTAAFFSHAAALSSVMSLILFLNFFLLFCHVHKGIHRHFNLWCFAVKSYQQEWSQPFGQIYWQQLKMLPWLLHHATLRSRLIVTN